ncbi:MAG: hypothetical protein KGH72_03760 [Candidatus Micrarchaeota archaeon]|nr:hypothetical protein [Candidatus Micrarchaeota archaeon]
MAFSRQHISKVETERMMDLHVHRAMHPGGWNDGNSRARLELMLADDPEIVTRLIRRHPSVLLLDPQLDSGKHGWRKANLAEVAAFQSEKGAEEVFRLILPDSALLTIDGQKLLSAVVPNSTFAVRSLLRDAPYVLEAATGYGPHGEIEGKLVDTIVLTNVVDAVDVKFLPLIMDMMGKGIAIQDSTLVSALRNLHSALIGESLVYVGTREITGLFYTEHPHLSDRLRGRIASKLQETATVFEDMLR